MDDPDFRCFVDSNVWLYAFIIGQDKAKSQKAQKLLLTSQENLMEAASDLRQRYSFSYWDSLIVAAALSANAMVLYSEDMQDGLEINGRLTIKNPL